MIYLSQYCGSTYNCKPIYSSGVARTLRLQVYKPLKFNLNQFSSYLGRSTQICSEMQQKIKLQHLSMILCVFDDMWQSVNPKLILLSLVCVRTVPRRYYVQMFSFMTANKVFLLFYMFPDSLEGSSSNHSSIRAAVNFYSYFHKAVFR